MSYVDPQTVHSPKSRLSDLEILYDAGPGEWAIARFHWDHKPAVGIRWNGEEGEEGVGNPQSRGLPTWFVVPRELEGAVLEVAQRFSEHLAAGYADMAKDRAREQEASDWVEGLIGDASAQR
jgi:hypothetical protein